MSKNKIEELFSSNYTNLGIPVIDVFKSNVEKLNNSRKEIRDFLSTELFITKNLLNFFNESMSLDDIRPFFDEISGFIFLFYTERLKGYKKIKSIPEIISSSFEHENFEIHRKMILIFYRKYKFKRMRECLKLNRLTKIEISRLKQKNSSLNKNSNKLDGDFLKRTSRRSFLSIIGKITLGSAIFGLPSILNAQSTNIFAPGVGTVRLSDPIIEGGNFTWGEATRNGERVPPTSKEVENILKSAKYMQEIRKLFGDKPIRVTSWYRDLRTNRSIGSSDSSRHVQGDAVDFVISGVSVEETYRKLDGFHGNKGGLARDTRRGFVHVDLRGTRARWNY